MTSNWSQALTALIPQTPMTPAPTPETRSRPSVINRNRESDMDQAHEAHLRRILDAFGADARAKYAAGQREHGGNLWEKPGMLEHAIEEAIDLVVYLFTLREQIERGVER